MRHLWAMYSVCFNEKSQAFTIVSPGVSTSTFHDGHEVFRTEQLDEAVGVIKGLCFARYLQGPRYLVNDMLLAASKVFFTIKEEGVSSGDSRLWSGAGEHSESGFILKVFDSDEEAVKAGLKLGEVYLAGDKHYAPPRTFVRVGVNSGLGSNDVAGDLPVEFELYPSLEKEFKNRDFTYTPKTEALLSIHKAICKVKMLSGFDISGDELYFYGYGHLFCIKAEDNGLKVFRSGVPIRDFPSKEGVIEMFTNTTTNANN